MSNKKVKSTVELDVTVDVGIVPSTVTIDEALSTVDAPVVDTVTVVDRNNVPFENVAVSHIYNQVSFTGADRLTQQQASTLKDAARVLINSTAGQIDRTNTVISILSTLIEHAKAVQNRAIWARTEARKLNK